MANHRHSYSYTKHIPNKLSFSSTLLEEICRSISDDNDDDHLLISSMRRNNAFKTDQEQMANYQRACMIEKWMEKKAAEKILVRGKSMADLKLSRKDRQGSSSSSSDSSCGGGGFFSSSETESFAVNRIPRPVRTGGEPGKVPDKPKKHESGLLKTKSRALKMYGDLKKIKQPISPGGKVAAFLNSIFTAKKAKAADSPSCSSARSCLSKTTTPSGGGKRSVRFSTPSKIESDDVGFIKSAIEETNRKVEEAARDFLKKYELDDEDDDAESCASSDLFELDIVSAIGVDRRYTEELPVYETTDFHKIQTMQMP